MTFTMPKAAFGYDAGAPLRDVTLAEARSWDCNRCGDCCDSSREDVRKDIATGLPLLVWGSKFPADRYEARYGEPLLLPIVEREGQLQVGDSFEIDADGKPYTCFRCAFHDDPGDGGPTSCRLMAQHPEPAPDHIEQIRPLSCGEFPVFGTAVDDAIIGGHEFVPATGALPRCEWHGIRIVGPWKDTPYWRERWDRQQLGLPVADLTLSQDFVRGIAAKTAQRKVTSDGSAPKKR